MSRSGPRNSITDVAGIAVGQAGDPALGTGVTVILPDRPASAAVDIRGGAPGTRETGLLRPEATVERIDAIVLSGGSAFGLDAASGVTHWLRDRGRGYPTPAGPVPIVPAAILYDLGRGARDPRDDPPWARFGREAAERAGPDVELGSTGAGTGAMAGGLKGGIGTASWTADGVTVGAIAAVNPLGSIVMPGTATPWAWWLEQDGEFGGLAPPDRAPDADRDPCAGPAAPNTLIAVVATDLGLTGAQALRVAMMAQDGIARAIRPSHTPLDGDVVFALSTGARPLDDPVRGLGRIGACAADCLARAITRGVIAATAIGDGVPAWRDL